MSITTINKNLKDEQYYIDQYDRYTVEECRRRERSFLEADLGEEIKSKYPIEVQREQLQRIIHMTLYFLRADRYMKKAEAIKGWMNQDRRKDEIFERAQPPGGISCLKCNSKMISIDKDLYWSDYERVLFLFECNKCSKRRAFFDNGEEFDVTHKCSQCKNTVQTTHSREKNKITTKYNCHHCGFTGTDVLDLDEKPKEIKEIIDKDFEVDRKRFCFSEEEGKKHIASQPAIENMCRLVDEWREKDKHKELYDAVAKVKKLNIADLEKQLVLALEKESFKKLEFSKPDIGRVVVIEFTLQDTTSGTNENARRLTLKKTINEALIETNWKLVEDSIMYKLGFLSGRIRGFELEEDIVELVKARRQKVKKSTL